MAKKKITKKKIIKKKVDPIDKFLETISPGVFLSIVIAGSIYLGGYTIDSLTYQNGSCHAHTNNTRYRKTYAKIDYTWHSVGKIDYEFSLIDTSKIGIDSYEIDTKTRSLDSFKDVYPDKIDCSLYEIHKVDIKLEQLKAKLAEKK